MLVSPTNQIVTCTYSDDDDDDDDDSNNNNNNNNNINQKFITRLFHENMIKSVEQLT